MVRETQGSSQRYVASPVPNAADALPAFLRTELLRIEAALSAAADGYLDVTTVAPIKPRDGMLRRANGVSWNPGSGPGVYCFFNASWHFLG